MTIRTSCVSGAPVALMLGLLAWWPPAAALAQGKTDVVTLANGDRITGEVKRLERGRLVFETADAGTLYLEWDKLASVESKQQVEVTTADGQRYLGSLGPAPDHSVAVIEATNAATTLAMADVTELHPIGRRFWSKVDGSLDVGFSYTRSSGVAQLNFNSDTGLSASRVRRARDGTPRLEPTHLGRRPTPLAARTNVGKGHGMSRSQKRVMAMWLVVCLGGGLEDAWAQDKPKEPPRLGGPTARTSASSSPPATQPLRPGDSTTSCGMCGRTPASSSKETSFDPTRQTTASS
jgi:hypothetical protein